MAFRLGRLAGFVSAVVITGCASESQPVPPAPPAITIPDLRGTWDGTWSGTPLTLLVIEQHETGAYSGFYLGSVPLLGQRVPNVNGVMTSTIRGDAVSIGIEGWFGYANAGLILLVKGATSDGTQQLMLTRVDPERLAGTGESSFRWGPRGSVELTRRSAGPAAASFPAAGTFSRLIGERQSQANEARRTSASPPTERADLAAPARMTPCAPRPAHPRSEPTSRPPLE